MPIALRGILILLLAAGAFASGVWLRVRLWDWTLHSRFLPDITNGYNWGREADRVGYLNLYETLGQPERGRRYTDYAPLRLGVMSAWVQWLKWREYPLTPYPDDNAQFTRDYHAPLLNFNMTLETLTALSAALLAWHVRRRNAAPGDRWGAAWLALIAGLLVWFNPALIYEAHAWPQWDIWPMPFFLLALYCGFRRWWLVAGLLIGAGSMLKGQILIVGWTIPLWALCVGDWRGTFRVVLGAYVAIMLIGSPWVFSHYDPTTSARAIHTDAIGITNLATLAAILLPRRFSPTRVCAVLAVCLYVSMRYLGGTDYWLQSSFSVGTWNYPRMIMGSTSNLPAILQHRYGFTDVHYVLFTLPALAYFDASGAEQWRWGGQVTIRTLMLSIFFTLSAINAIRAAMLDRQRDPRVLLALTLPWLLFFLIPCQIHERYLIFAAICSATWAVCSPGILMIGVIVTLVAAIHMMQWTLGGSVDVARRLGELPGRPLQQIRQWLDGTHPDIAWLLLLAAAVLLYNILTPRLRRGDDGTEPHA